MCPFRLPTNALAGCLLAALCSAAAAVEQPKALDAYLERLGLVDLRLHSLERQLARAVDANQKERLAQTIVDGYAEQLIAAADEPERFAALKARVERLLGEAPQARTPAIEILLLQADYQRAEALVLAWQEQADASDLPAEAREVLERVQSQLSAHQETLVQSADQAAETLDSIASEAVRQSTEKQILQQRTLAARADYFAGWSAYYLALLQPETAAMDFAAAKQHFLRLLDIIDEREYSPIGAADLGLGSVWRARSVIGLGLAEIGLKNHAAAERIFSWLSDSTVASNLRDQAHYWRLQGYVNTRQWETAARLATADVNGFASTPSAGKTSLCTAAIRAALQADGEASRRLMEAGLRGLAHLRQFEALDKLIARHELDRRMPDNFHLLWLRGRRRYLEAEKAKDEAGFRAAAEPLAAALKTADARQELVEAGQARYYLGWARYRLEEIESAAVLFREAATALRVELPEVAVQAAWMHCTCLVKRTERDPKMATAAVTALATFKQDYPTSQEAQQVDLLMARLRQSHLPPEQSIRELSKIKPDDPNYVAAQLEICQLLHQQTKSSKADSAKRAAAARDVLEAAEKILAAASAAPEQRLRAALLAIDALASGKETDWRRVGSLLERAASDAGIMGEGNAARVEYEYRRLELAQQNGNSLEAQRAADWIAEHGRGTPYELPALILVARAADKAVQDAPSAGRASAVGHAHEVYQRLVQLLGDDQGKFVESKNALAAASRLAQMDEELGRFSEAADRLERLILAVPQDRRFLRRAGVAWFQAGRPENALPHWRTLLAGLEAGSEEWLEAKYFQIACLETTDRSSARKVLTQFQLLYPEVKSTVWKDKFQELSKRVLN